MGINGIDAWIVIRNNICGVNERQTIKVPQKEGASDSWQGKNFLDDSGLQGNCQDVSV